MKEYRCTDRLCHNPNCAEIGIHDAANATSAHDAHAAVNKKMCHLIRKRLKCPAKW